MLPGRLDVIPRGKQWVRECQRVETQNQSSHERKTQENNRIIAPMPNLKVLLGHIFWELGGLPTRAVADELEELNFFRVVLTVVPSTLSERRLTVKSCQFPND